MPKSKSSPSRNEAIDYDGLTKDFITYFFKDFILFVNIALHDAIDWSQEPVFLEQEFINNLKGRYKIKGKRRQTDKLVLLKMLDGSERFIYIHCEFQHRPEENFPKRMFSYFYLNILRYDPERFTAIAFFTGAPPDPSQLEYKFEHFGTQLTYKFNSLVCAQQEEKKLIDSDNPVALAVLAALYAWKTEHNPQERIIFKKKIFDWAAKKGFDDEKLTKILTFVFDFVHLPKSLEETFLQETAKATLQIIDTAMTEPTYRVKNYANLVYELAYGHSLKSEREAVQREAAQREREVLMFKFYQEAGIEPARLAQIFECEVSYVEAVIKRHLDAMEQKAQHGTDEQEHQINTPVN